MDFCEKWILPGESFDGSRMVRSAVFIDEQNFSHKDEWDEFDAVAYHYELWYNNAPVACGRLYEREDSFRIGRIAVIKAMRAHSLGSRIVTSLEQKAVELGAKKITVAAQISALGFYKKLGYTELDGSQFYDGQTPHIIVYKNI